MGRNLLTDFAPYPWDGLRDLKALAASHPGGLVDLSVGSPVDETPALIQNALAAAANAPGYPTAASTTELRTALVDWYARRRGVPGLTGDNVLTTVGSKEFIAFLPFWLGMGEGDVMVQPRVHYPAYEVGSEFTGSTVVSEDDPSRWPVGTRLIWLNSPGNPDGVVHDVPYLRAAVARARELGAVLVQDECYAELGWDGPWRTGRIPSLLDPRVTNGDLSGLLAIYSLSKQSNLAGYRAGIAAGSSTLIAGLVNIRKQAGLAVPAPIQAAMTAALGDDEHVAAQKERYRARRDTLLPAVRAFGLDIEQSVAGLYIWATAHEDTWVTVRRLAELGILVGPGAFYGDAAMHHVRFALTATDAKIDEAAARLTAREPVQRESQ